ncbi:hypothetical protein JAAARDRAFT_256405 [Jaapia argillacea MUCL 33604]|uniref:Uncharacterized protein n=1 Tax=Jaapia argillacea MUCL 33604 TaxID=933084 RepID=A0A067PTD4_9AGAM|nr:hypothetical protein JAAARDRAFT_256405 [Jaapia argillacea MUCL 33604]
MHSPISIGQRLSTRVKFTLRKFLITMRVQITSLRQRKVTVFVVGQRVPADSTGHYPTEEIDIVVQALPTQMDLGGSWEATSFNVVSQLQQTSACIYGAAKICVASVRPGSVRPIARILEMGDVIYEPMNVRVSGQDCPQLHGPSYIKTEAVGDGSSLTLAPPSSILPSLKRTPSPDPEDIKALLPLNFQPKKSRTTFETGDKKEARKEKKEQERAEIVSYLQGQLALRDGWLAFSQAKGKQLYAAEIVKNYRFARQFIGDFNNCSTSRIRVSLSLSLVFRCVPLTKYAGHSRRSCAKPRPHDNTVSHFKDSHSCRIECGHFLGVGNGQSPQAG